MKYQEPAKNILLQHEFDTSSFYKIDCNCNHEDDEVILEIGLDPKMKTTTIHHYTTQYIHSDNLKDKLRITWDLWVKGYVKYHQETLLNEQTAYNYAVTILKQLKRFK